MEYKSLLNESSKIGLSFENSANTASSFNYLLNYKKEDARGSPLVPAPTVAIIQSITESDSNESLNRERNEHILIPNIAGR
jgi:hypothetical protein